MKIKVTLFILLIICVLFQESCHKMASTNTLYFIEVSRDSLTEPSSSGSDSIIINSNIGWSISGLPAGFSSNVSVGNAGSTKLIIHFPAYTQSGAFQSQFIIFPEGGYDVKADTIFFIQKGAIALLSTDKSIITGKPEGATDSLIITSSTPWQVNIPSVCTWITADRISGSAGISKIHLTISPNNSGLARSAEINISGRDQQTVKIEVNQNIFYYINKISPGSGNEGSQVSLFGVFGSNPSVSLNSLPCKIVTSNSGKIDFLIPKSAKSGKISVECDNGIHLQSLNDFIITGTSGEVTGPQSFEYDQGISFTYNNEIYFGLGINLTSNKYNYDFQIYDPEHQIWKQGPKIAAGMNPRRYSCCFVLGSKVYIGPGAYTNEDDWWELDLTQISMVDGAWKQITSYPVKGWGGLAFILNNTAYAGLPYWDGNLDEFDPAANNGLGSWNIKIAGVFPQLLYSSIFIIRDTLFIAGGQSKTGISNNVYRFDMNSGVKSLSSFPIPFANAPSFALDGYGYILFNKTIYKYDPNKNSWSNLNIETPLFTGTYNAAVINSKIYAFKADGTVYIIGL